MGSTTITNFGSFGKNNLITCSLHYKSIHNPCVEGGQFWISHQPMWSKPVIEMFRYNSNTFDEQTAEYTECELTVNNYTRARTVLVDYSRPWSFAYLKRSKTDAQSLSVPNEECPKMSPHSAAITVESHQSVTIVYGLTSFTVKIFLKSANDLPLRT